MVQPLQSKKPELLATRFTLFWNIDWRLRGVLKSIRSILESLIKLFMRSGRITDSLGRSDVFIFYSSNKPNWQPALDSLAHQLSEDGITCRVVTPKILEPLKTNIVGAAAGLFDLLASFWITLGIFLTTVIQLPQVFFIFIRNPIGVWNEIWSSRLRMRTVRCLMKQIQPSLIITNGDHLAWGSELALMAPKGCHKIWFFNEWPTSDMLPFISDEVWVWNETAKKTFESLASDSLQTTINVVGRPEVDFCRRGADRIPSQPIFVFLSEYIWNPFLKMEALTQEAFRWIAEAAQQLPHWKFIVKSRPMQQHLRIPGVSLLEGLPNVFIPSEEKDLFSYLEDPNVVSLGACASSGLLVAAACGKHPFRFLISSNQIKLPVLDEVVTSISSTDHFITELKLIEKSNYAPKIYNNKNVLFPYQGEAVARMKSLCRLWYKKALNDEPIRQHTQ